MNQHYHEQDASKCLRQDDLHYTADIKLAENALEQLDHEEQAIKEHSLARLTEVSLGMKNAERDSRDTENGLEERHGNVDLRQA
jgi:hypothetical protein